MEYLDTIVDALNNKKAVDPVVIDVQEMSTVTSYFVVATGSSAPHIKALFEEVKVKMKGAMKGEGRYAGTAESGWMVLDYLNVIVHIFSPEARERYALEELWSESPLKHLET